MLSKKRNRIEDGRNPVFSVTFLNIATFSEIYTFILVNSSDSSGVKHLYFIPGGGFLLEVLKLVVILQNILIVIRLFQMLILENLSNSEDAY